MRPTSNPKDMEDAGIRRYEEEGANYVLAVWPSGSLRPAARIRSVTNAEE